jgi:hypothetical protein
VSRYSRGQKELGGLFAAVILIVLSFQGCHNADVRTES